MCGFTGWFDEHPMEREVLERMNARLAMRGPDGSGIYCHGPIGLGHRRLAIIDLAASVQPMVEGRYALAYNGELYNFKELKQELELLGHAFRTQGDTEVLLHALIEWKEEALPKLQGMFAFAFWDGETLLLARDHLGVKPLYICHAGNRLIFGSEIKALLEHPAVSREIDPQAIALYLECQYIPTPYSIFTHIRKLPAAHFALFKGGELVQKRYWSPSYLPKWNFSEEEAVLHLEKELRRSVKSMLIADVPLGAFVSGGIDSSLVAALMQRESGQKAKIFSIGVDHVDGEQQYAAQVATYLGAEFHPLLVTAQDMISAIDQIFDEPFGDQAALPTLLLSKLTRESVKVVLTGEGADEILAGYSNYPKRLKEASICAKWNPFYAPLHPFMPEKLRKNRLMKAMSRPLSQRYTTIPSLFDVEVHRSLLTKSFRSMGGISLQDLAAPRFFDCDSTEYLDKMLHIDTTLWLPDDLLTKVDLATMSHSLEARVPYLDHKLVEFAARLPAHFKLQGASGKYLLKKVAAQGWLPPDIVHRAKRGFVMPLKEWMDGELKGVVSDALHELQKRGLFRPNLAKRKDLHATRLFALLNLELWFRKMAPTYRF
jgi:asparagine synthase (glutamine-hydrolysing)